MAERQQPGRGADELNSDMGSNRRNQVDSRPTFDAGSNPDQVAEYKRRRREQADSQDCCFVKTFCCCIR